MHHSISSIVKLLEDGADVKHLEKEVFAVACEIASGMFSQILQMVDEVLLKQKDKDLTVVGFREKTVQMLFGRLTVRRRLYRTKDGAYRFLLDEALGLERHARMSPSLAEASAILATYMPFRRVAEVIAKLTPAAASHMGIYNHFRQAADTLDAEDEKRARALFEDGVIEATDAKSVEHLFVEADGLFVHLQREDKKKTELKLGVAYEGLDSIGKGRYKTLGKVAYSGMLSSEAFWQRFSERLTRSYDLGAVKRVSLGGDGARWIKAGAELFRHATFTLDRFHLHRALMRALPAGLHAQALALAKEADMEGLTALFETARETADEKAKKRLDKAKAYLFSNKDGLKKEVPERGLGTMEGQIDKILAHRMKKRGMSWSLDGAHRMAHMLALRENGELVLRLEQTHVPVSSPIAIVPPPLSLPKDPGDWMRASLPALSGPYRNRPWVAVLRGIAGMETFA